MGRRMDNEMAKGDAMCVGSVCNYKIYWPDAKLLIPLTALQWVSFT